MTQLRLAYVNVNIAPRARGRETAMSPEALEVARTFDRLVKARPSAGPVFKNLIYQMVDEAEGRKL